MISHICNKDAAWAALEPHSPRASHSRPTQAAVPRISTHLRDAVPRIPMQLEAAVPVISTQLEAVIRRILMTL